MKFYDDTLISQLEFYLDNTDVTSQNEKHIALVQRAVRKLKENDRDIERLKSSLVIFLGKMLFIRGDGNG